MAIFSLVYVDEDLKHTFPTIFYFFYFVLVPWDFSKATPQRHTATHNTNKSSDDEKKAGNKT